MCRRAWVLMVFGWLVGCAGSIPEPPIALNVASRVETRAAEDQLEERPRRALETRLQGIPLPPIPRTHPRIGRLTGRGSLAIGTTRDGFVVDCRPLPLEGPHHRVLAVQAQRGTNCGTDEMVSALIRAAEAVARRHPGAVLTLGNLSRVGGGDIPWSISHNSGRDADIGFYLLGPDRRQVVPDTFVSLDANGRGVWLDKMGGREVPVRLDVPRTWWLVRTLLTDPQIEVQWLFVSRPIREILLEYAKRRGEPEAIQARAAEALAQPGRALPHDDHIHLRVYCSVDDLYEGCQDRGSDRPWHVTRTERIQARVRELRGLLASKSVATRAAAITVLGRLGRRELLPEFVRALSSSEPEVRLAAARALREMGAEGAEDSVMRVLQRTSDDTVIPILLDALNHTLHGRRRIEVLARLLDVNREYRLDFDVFEIRQRVSEWALEELEASAVEMVVPVLIRTLKRPGVDQAALNRSLARLTGFKPEDDLLRAWEEWWRVNRRRTPEQWYIEAFRKAGVLDDDIVGPVGMEALSRVVQEDASREALGRAAWTLIRRSATRLMPGWRRPWPPDSIEAWGVLAQSIGESLFAESARSRAVKPIFCERQCPLEGSADHP